MEDYKEFFDNLNRNIREAKSRKTLKILEKQGRRYVINIPSYTDSKIKKEIKKEFKENLKLIKKQYKKLK